MRRGLPPLLRRYWLWTLALTAAAWLWTWSMTHVVGMRPYSTILQLRNPMTFGDFWLFQGRFQAFGTDAFWHRDDYPFTYPALLGVVFAVLFRLPHPLRSFLLLYAAALLLWVVWLGRRLHVAGVPLHSALGFAASVLVTCWPVIFLLDTANIEGVVVLVVAAGLFAVLADRWWLAAVLFGLAGAMKFYPLVMLGLVLSQRRYREFAAGLAAGLAANFAALWALGPTVAEAQHHIAQGLLYVERRHMSSLLPEGLPFNHSLFNVVKFAAVGLTGNRSGVLIDRTLLVYAVCAAALGVALYFVRIQRLPLLNRVLALLACGVLLPPLSADYTLCELLVPFGLLCWYVADVWMHGEPPVPGTRPALAAFGLLFPAGTYFTWHHMFACQVRTAGLVLLLVAVLRSPFPDREGLRAGARQSGVAA